MKNMNNIFKGNGMKSKKQNHLLTKKKQQASKYDFNFNIHDDIYFNSRIE